MSFQLRTFALDDIYDVNNVTNMYTTLHFTLKYVDEVVLDQYLRLCDYVSVNHMTSYYVPGGVFSGIDNLFTYGGTQTQTITTLLRVNGTTTTTSLIERTTQGGYNFTRSLNSTGDDPDILPVGIQKRLFSSNASLAVSNDSLFFSSKYYGKELPEETSGAVVTLPESVETVQVVLPTTVFSDTAVVTAALQSVQPPVAATTDDASPLPTASSLSVSSTTSLPSILPSSCPIFKDNEITINLSAEVGHRSAFGSFELQVQIISPDANHSVIGCSSSFISTVQKQRTSSFLTAFFASVLIILFISNFANIFLSPYQDSNDVFLMPAALICNGPLLNQVTPSFVDFLYYLQFVFFMVALNLHFPGFLSPLVATFRWVAFLRTGGYSCESIGNVYQTIYTGGLKSLLNGGGDHSMSGQWMWFLLDFTIFTACYILLHNIIFATVYFVQRIGGKKSVRVTTHSTRTSLYFNLGLVLYSFLRVATLPLLTIGLYILATFNKNPYGGPSSHENFAAWCVATAAIAFSVYIVMVSFFGFRYVFSATGKNKLYTKLSTMLTWNYFYSGFNVSKVAFVLVDQFEILLFSIAVGCLQWSGMMQLILIIIVKFLYFLLLVIYKPYYSKTRMNRNRIACSATHILVSLLHIPFLYRLDASEELRTRFVWAISIIHLIAIVFLFVIPTVHNIYLCCKLYLKYRKGHKGTDIPDYRDNGDFIELPFSSDNRSLLSNGTFADLVTMPPLSPSVSGILHDNESYTVPENNDCSSSSSSISCHTSVPMRTARDWTVREADMYYNVPRILGPDPEVRQLWEERGRKLHKAKNALAEKARSENQSQVEEKWDWLDTLKRVHFIRRPIKSFEVMRPHPLTFDGSNLVRMETRNTPSTGTDTLAERCMSKGSTSTLDSEETQNNGSIRSSFASVFGLGSAGHTLRVVNTTEEEQK
ncbi:DEKNAAC105431 [Brettanomyces naardenensis]|uniref:DEKNAAC105431 n=1 Tax=Brettanomyces naardenensis TaxID=13370 RepID=A0A448YTG3_BRENA|nr:DEKNAAC105431 [Brettanomyces naardenensis]